MAAPMTSPARMTRQLSAATGTRPTYLAVRIQPATASASSVKTVAQLAPMKLKGGISARLSPTLATTLHAAAQEKEDCRSDAFSAPMKVLLMNAIPRARARILRAGSDAP